MSDPSPQSPLDRNLETLLQSTLGAATPAFQEKLTREVLLEVRQQRQRHVRTIRFKLAFVGAAAVVLVGMILWWNQDHTRQPMAQVSHLYGRVTVQSNGSTQAIQQLKSYWLVLNESPPNGGPGR